MTKFLILFLVFLSSTAFANPLYLLASLSGTGNVPVSYLLGPVLFEEAGPPTNWSTVTDVSYDYTTNPLEGLQSLRISTTGSNRTVPTPNFTPSNDVYIAYRARFDQFPGVESNTLWAVTGTSNLALLSLTSAGYLKGQTDGGSSVTSVIQLTAGANYYLKVRYQRLGDTNNTMTVWVSNTGATGTWVQHINAVGGTTAGSVDNFRWRSMGAGVNIIVDDVRVDDSDINW